jgi:hypothetical protein
MKQLSLLSLIFFVFIISSARAQEKPCEVMVKNIQGVYAGPCINGKANGQGKSTGIDTYDGYFKNGYPEGEGTYTWQNKNSYTGNWRKGKMDGMGEMHYTTASGDSVVTGFWKSDKYVGLYEKKYDVIAMSSRINRVNCTLIDKRGSDITITVHQMTSSANRAWLAAVNGINVLKGNFYAQNTQRLTNSTVTKISNVTFPFRANFSISSETTDILFNEKGSYDVYVDIQ